MATKTLYFSNPRHLNQLFAGHEGNLAYAESTLRAKLTTREEWLKIDADETTISKVEALFGFLDQARAQGVSIRTPDFNRFVDLIAQDHADELRSLFADPLVIKTRRKSIVPKTLGQKLYLQSMIRCPVVFGIGPAGTGKTYTAVALAVKALKEKEVKRIILTRPAVEAGENLGFLPGDLKEKLDPYMQPLYDALRDMVPVEKLSAHIENGIIQIAPLAFMRGRTLDNAFVILDEAQNTTHAQMKMFLTRMGRNARFIITGDPGQIDLPRRVTSGLKEALLILKGTKGIGIATLDEKDVIRHPLVKKVIYAYKHIEHTN